MVKGGPQGRACDPYFRVTHISQGEIITVLATARLRRQRAIPTQDESPQVRIALPLAGGNDAQLYPVT